MTLDVMRGRGAFKCGCGARIMLTIAASTSCGALGTDGDRCPVVPVRESAEFNLFLCRDHLEAHKEHLEEVKAKATDKRAERAYWDHQEELSREHSRARRTRRETLVERARAEGTAVVYYIRIGDYIKIGTTVNLGNRMSALQPDEILATEPGYLEMEDLRHEQFKHLRIRPQSERHHKGPDLLDHIEMLRKHYGGPQARFDTQAVPDAR